MDRIIYTAANGAARILEQQSAISNNLANATTTGFRAALDVYRAVPIQPQAGESPTRVSTILASHGADLSEGVLVETEDPLNAAVTGPGWFAVQTPQGEAYTRRGDFSVSRTGELVIGAGLPVLSADDQVLEIPERGALTFSEDGRITVLGAGDRPGDLQQVGQLKLVNPPPEQLRRRPDGLFSVDGAQVVPSDENVRILPGFLEKSNVQPAQAMVALISNARAFEQQMKVIQAADDNDQRGNSILSAAG